MSGNFPSGFSGFQARLQATIEACGGDELARMAVEREFRSALEREVRDRETETGADRNFHYPRPHLGAWLAASDEDFDKAGAWAEGQFEFADGVEPQIPDGETFRVVWGERAIARATRKAGIVLAERRRNLVSFTDAGAAMARDNGVRLRSHHRTFGSEEAAIAFLPKLATREFRLPCGKVDKSGDK